MLKTTKPQTGRFTNSYLKNAIRSHEFRNQTTFRTVDNHRNSSNGYIAESVDESDTASQYLRSQVNFKGKAGPRNAGLSGGQDYLRTL